MYMITCIYVCDCLPILFLCMDCVLLLFLIDVSQIGSIQEMC